MTLVLEEAELAIMLRGDLAAILRCAANKKNPTSFRRPGFWVSCFARIVGRRDTQQPRAELLRLRAPVVVKELQSRFCSG